MERVAAGAHRLAEQAFEARVERDDGQRHAHRHQRLDDQRADPLAHRLDELDRIGRRSRAASAIASAMRRKSLSGTPSASKARHEAASAGSGSGCGREAGDELRRALLERVEQLLHFVHAEQVGGGGLDDLVEMGGDDGGRIDDGIAGDHRVGALRRAGSRPRRGRRSDP